MASGELISRAERPHFEFARQWVNEHLGLYYPEQKTIVLYNRLQKVCRRMKLPGLEALALHLERDDLPDLPREVARAVSTNHSYFFREEQVLQFLRDSIIPALPPGETWRVWSAACASGEEVYTVAILFAESLGMARALERVAVLGTDVDRSMIEQAEQGTYPAQRLEQVLPHLRKRYFRRVKSGKWEVNGYLRQMSTFRVLNLMSAPWPFRHDFHVILCRNVLYYFDPDRQRALAERLYDAAAPGGWLLTSVTEPLQPLHTRWRPATTGVYRKMQ